MTFKNLTLILLLFQLASCSQKVYTPSLSSNNNTEEGTISLQCSGFGNTLEEAVNDAVSRSFSTILFKGIPESIQSTPLISDEQKARREHPGLLDCISKKDCNSQFITQMGNTGSKTKVKGGYSTMVALKINIRSLRNYLEQNNIIRKFGY